MPLKELPLRVRWILSVMKQMSQPRRSLNVGCWGGSVPNFHAHLVRARPRVPLFGIDLDVSRIVSRAHHGTLAADVLRAPFRSCSFDCIVLGEVIEHTLSPAEMLRECRRLLAPGGRLILTTPNPFSINRQARWWLGSRRPESPLVFERYLGDADHKCFLDPLSLNKLLHVTGFDVTHLTTLGHRIPFLARFFPSLGDLDLSVYPLSRLGSYTCIIAVARTPA